MPYTQVANLDFNEIKAALKDYLRVNSDFTDYDFEGSALATLIDTLAYNTYYTAFNANMTVNEMFIDSASLRDNVVSLAKQLGYRPKSTVSPTANVNLAVTYAAATVDTSLTLKAGTGFVSSFDNTLYQYAVTRDVLGQVVNGVVNFDDLELKEGAMLTNTYTFNSALTSQRFILDNPGIDTSTIQIKVYPSAVATIFKEYKLSENILEAKPSSEIYFLEEVSEQRYEVLFGDGVLGRKLENGEKIEISYLVTAGAESNGAKTFTFSGTLVNQTGNNPATVVATVSTVSVATGGTAAESVDKIKFTAPKMFAAQDRAVTAGDYGAIVRNLYPSVSDIIVFGGEDAEPPAYGKVFIAVKPEDAARLTSVTKEEIRGKLKEYRVAAITPELIDPSILYVEVNSRIFFDSSKTELTKTQIRDNAISEFQSYINTSNTEKFNGKFRYSKAVAVIDNSDISINSNLTSVKMRKDFFAQINSTSFYEVCYQNAFLDDDDPVVSSTGFVVTEYPTFTVYLEDRLGKMILYRLDGITGEKVLLDDNVGDVDYAKGEIKLYDVTIIKGTFGDNRIELRVRPLENDIVAKREVYLDVDVAKSSFAAFSE
ncbi:baseplate wedge subunit [Synechococcus phage ACG-2014h]|uniref:Baseplate wedge n=1 Tax=Synechococcus phage ACG-2014h TaxID=1340810 RepID=V5UT26_9CAUD|nr:baseplate wedge subunit [Synechococcus phage ACG-2014h]AHB80490.1 baseplate wedge [Synechococcus phage ACG-2014h]